MMPAIAKASDSVNTLIRKYRIVIVTARAPLSDSWTKSWLSKNDIPYDAYVNVKEGSKQNIDFDASILIDDYLGNIEEFLQQSDGVAILVFATVESRPCPFTSVDRRGSAVHR